MGKRKRKRSKKYHIGKKKHEKQKTKSRGKMEGKKIVVKKQTVGRGYCLNVQRRLGKNGRLTDGMTTRLVLFLLLTRSCQWLEATMADSGRCRVG